MIKICSICGGLGYEKFDLDGTDIDLCCDNCMGEGSYEKSSTLAVIKIIDKLGDYADGIILDIEDTINRPNNPEVDEIVETYMKYHYGELIDYNYKTTRNKIVTIDEEWNIENYR